MYKNFILRLVSYITLIAMLNFQTNASIVKKDFLWTIYSLPFAFFSVSEAAERQTTAAIFWGTIAAGLITLDEANIEFDIRESLQSIPENIFETIENKYIQY